MAQPSTHEVASRLRDGSVWIGHFVARDGELDFGDDRFDAAHGLAKLLRVESTSAPRAASPGVQRGNGSADPAAQRKAATSSHPIGRPARLRLAA